MNKKKCTEKEHIKNMEKNKNIDLKDLPDRTLIYCSICGECLGEFD